MTAFASLAALPRALFALWALLLCLTDMGSGLLAAARKRFRDTAFALALLVPVYLMWQVIFDLRLFGGSERAAALSRTLGGCPWLYWLAVFALLTLAVASALRNNVRYDRDTVSFGTIKLYLDRVPCGICCWRENGRILFSNVCINRLCLALTGGPLRNGNHFRDAVSGGILTAEGKVWRFSCRDFSLNGEMLHELVASDITAEYAKTQALEQDKAELARLNRELGEYYHSMDDIIRRREILQAKINIHDEMNRLMLSVTAANGQDTAAMDRIFSLWEQNALLLCMEADDRTDQKDAESLERLAAALGVSLNWRGAPPEALSGKQRALFYSVAREAVVNAVKHAGAKNVSVSFDERGADICCRFSNDGAPPDRPADFTGGLSNLRLMANRQGAALSARWREGFTLTLRFPKNQPIG